MRDASGHVGPQSITVVGGLPTVPLMVPVPVLFVLLTVSRGGEATTTSKVVSLIIGGSTLVALTVTGNLPGVWGGCGSVIVKPVRNTGVP